MVATDKTLICRECGNPFVFTAGEQAFYAERGFVEPSRCPTCRANRRAGRQASDGNAFGAPRDGTAGAVHQPRQLYPAICAECGRDTMVPFEPRAGRPVYCRECFNRHRNAY